MTALMFDHKTIPITGKLWDLIAQDFSALYALTVFGPRPKETQ